MYLNINNMKELVKFCGGDPTMVEGWIEETKNKTITTIEELKDHPFKTDFGWMFRSDNKDVPYLAKMVRDLYYEERYERHEIIFLNDILDIMDADEYSENERTNIQNDLIKIKFGTMCYDW